MLIAQKDTIFIGADSRSLVLLRNDKTNNLDSIPHTICKIHNIDDIHFAVAGYPDEIITRIIYSNSNKYKKPYDLLISLQDSLIPWLEKNLEHIRQTDMLYFENRFITNDICSILFFGFGINGAYASTIDFDL
jgi:hypothetical protein